MKGLGLIAFFTVSAIVSLWAGIRSRIRVRRLMQEPVLDAPQCTIERVAVKRFFSETLMFRAAVEGRLDNRGSPVILADDVIDMQQQLGAFSRAVEEWQDAFKKDLDDEDRAALEERGVTSGRVASARELADVGNPDKLRRLLTELQDLEQRMKAPPRTTAYR